MKTVIMALLIAVVAAIITLALTTRSAEPHLTPADECMQEWNKLNNNSDERFGLTDEYNYLKTCEATR